MVLERPDTPLVMRERPVPAPRPGEILVEVAACGVCRTDLHVVDGELPDSEAADRAGPRDRRPRRGDRRGRRGLRASASASACRGSAHTCGVCPYCRDGRENLCDRAAVHRLYARRRLCDARGRRCALLLSAAGGGRRRGDRAAAVRRPDRLAQLPHGRRGRARSASTASAPPRTSWRRSRPGRAGASTPSRARGDAAAQDFRPIARRGVGRRLGRDAAGAARRRHHLCAGRRARAARRSRR